MQLPEYYEFYSHPKFNSGKRALETIPYELSTMDAVKPLVLSNMRASGHGTGKKLVKALYDSPVTIGAFYDEVPGVASIGLIRDLAQLFRDRGCDSLIVTGSGPVVDTAKGVNMLVSIEGLDPLAPGAGGLIGQNLKPLVYIPSVNACGSETSDSAVIDARTITSDRLCPDLIVIDPRMMAAEEPGEIINASMMVLTSAIEASSAAVCTPISETYSHAAIQFIYENLSAAVRKPGSRGPSMALANAAAMSGVALTGFSAGIVRSLGLALADLTGLPAGILMGVLLPFALEQKSISRKGVRDELLLALAGMEVYSETPVKERAGRGVEILREFIGGFRYHIPETLTEMNIPVYRLGQAAAAAAERSGEFSESDCMKLLNRAYAASGIDE